MTIEGKFWGYIGFDDCTAEREWTSSEVDILRTLADLIGSAIIRERYVEQLKDANTIVELSPTISLPPGRRPFPATDLCLAQCCHVWL